MDEAADPEEQVMDIEAEIYRTGIEEEILVPLVKLPVSDIADCILL